MIEKLKREEPLLYKFFETNYKVWIGYHAILQLNSKKDSNIPEEDELKINTELEKERSRVAQMQVKQALESARLMLAMSKQKSTT